jgi:C4-dicarboxylate-specific signal transduction histidine kinase
MNPKEFLENPNAIFERVHPDDREIMMQKTAQSAKNLTNFHWELRLLFPDNRIKWVQAASTPRREPDGSVIWDGLMIDITEKKTAQEIIESQKAKMVSSAKLAALGEMAAGVAHEINNPLTIIHTRAFQIKSMVESGKLSAEVLTHLSDKIMETVDRAAKIVRSLRHFARDSENEPEGMISLQNLLSETLELCRERFKNYNVKLEIGDIPPALALRCRSVQASQVLLNLLSNALDAVITQKESKQQWVRLEVQEISDGIQFIVTDSGDGIPENIRDNIFMPFFSTKEPGKGTGLGLSLSHGIMKEHGGKLYLNSSSKPTQFIAHFPKYRFSKVTRENSPSSL